MKKKLISTVLSFVMTASLLTGSLLAGSSSVSAKVSGSVCLDITGNNLETQDTYYMYSDTIKSNIQPVSGGGYMIVQYVGDQTLYVEYFDSSFKLINNKKITIDLPIYGAFYATDSNYYILSGQNNEAESDAQEVFRITKYDNNWNRLSSASMYGGNTVYPFNSGSARAASYGKYLVFRTCHTMYGDKSDPNKTRHQADVTLVVDTEQMKIVDSLVAPVKTRYGSMSHSFNQFVEINDGRVVAVEHGDANPRAIAMYSDQYKLGENAGDTIAKEEKLITYGDIDGQPYQYTGVSLGGFEILSGNYIVAGSRDIGNNINKRNIYLYYKGTNTSWCYNVTDYNNETTGASTPHLVKISESKALMLWLHDNKVCYTEVSSNGGWGKIYEMEGGLSDCDPQIIDGKVVWYTWKDSEVVFYTISVNDLSATSSTMSLIGHDYNYGNEVKDGKITVSCNKCGVSTTKTVPTEFSDLWENTTDGYYYGFSNQRFKVGSSKIWLKINAKYDLMDMELIPADTSMISIKEDPEFPTMTINKAGITKLTIRPKYNPAIGVDRIIRVGEDGSMDIKSCNISVDIQPNSVNTYMGQVPTVSVKYGDIPLSFPKDYRYSMDVKDNGTWAIITVKGEGLFANSSYEKSFEIKSKDDGDSGSGGGSTDGGSSNSGGTSGGSGTGGNSSSSGTGGNSGSSGTGGNSGSSGTGGNSGSSGTGGNSGSSGTGGNSGSSGTGGNSGNSSSGGNSNGSSSSGNSGEAGSGSDTSYDWSKGWNDVTDDGAKADWKQTDDSSWHVDWNVEGGDNPTGGAGAGSAAGGYSPIYRNEWVNGLWYDANGYQTYSGVLTWKSNATGWWLEDTAGWYPKSSWQKVDGIWYYFGADGYMAASEWVDGYWLSGNGALEYSGKGTWKGNSKGWWFEDTSGWWAQNCWQKINGSWYYFGSDGYMVTSQYVDGYWIGSDGVCQ